MTALMEEEFFYLYHTRGSWTAEAYRALGVYEKQVFFKHLEQRLQDEAESRANELSGLMTLLGGRRRS